MREVRRLAEGRRAAPEDQVSPPASSEGQCAVPVPPDVHHGHAGAVLVLEILLRRAGVLLVLWAPLPAEEKVPALELCAQAKVYGDFAVVDVEAEGAVLGNGVLDDEAVVPASSPSQETTRAGSEQVKAVNLPALGPGLG